MGTGCSLLAEPASTEGEIKVTIGSRVDRHVRRRTVIFVFGGPGTCKGRIVSDLHQGFGLHVIDVESLLLQNFGDVELTLENLFDLVEKEMRNGSSEAGFLIDLIPNLRNAERCLAKGNVRQLLEKFERDWPVAFALTLYGRLFVQSTKAEQILLDMQVDGANDEHDANRIRKRCTSFAASVQPVISYFRERTIRVQHGGVNYQELWDTVADLFWDLGFKTRGPVSTTVYFLLDKSEALRLPQYAKKEARLPRIPFILPPYLRAVSPNIPTVSPEQTFVWTPHNELRDIFDGVSAQISRQVSPHREKFIAHIYPFMERIEWEVEHDKAARSASARPPMRSKQPLFLLPVDNDEKTKGGRRLLATTQGDTCLFSADRPLAECRRVAVHYAQARAAATSIPQIK